LPPVCPECSHKDREHDRLVDENTDMAGDIEDLERKLGRLLEQNETLQDRNICLSARLRELEGE